MTFETWVAEVQAIVTFVIEPEEWRRYYDAKLSPSTPSRSTAPTTRSDLAPSMPRSACLATGRRDRDRAGVYGAWR